MFDIVLIKRLSREAYLEPYQTSDMKCFCKIDIGFSH